MNVLGIETSCDETAAAVVKDGVEILSSVVLSQAAEHEPFGGVVPEIAGRAHLNGVNPVVEQAFAEANLSWPDIDLVAVTYGPGLAGALLVGVASAKALAWAHGIPLVGVNHHEAHLLATALEHDQVRYPEVSLIVSGGHTLLVLLGGQNDIEIIGKTVDDAAGEAFDKVARLLGLGYPGGPAIEARAVSGDPKKFGFTRPKLADGFDFSFAGLKTAVRLELEELRMVSNNSVVDPQVVSDLAASFQEAVVDVLTQKLERAAVAQGAKTISLGGGVAANTPLRDRVVELGESLGIEVLIPDRSLCTDNAAMVAAAGYFKWAESGASMLDLGIDPSLQIGS